MRAELISFRGYREVASAASRQPTVMLRQTTSHMSRTVLINLLAIPNLLVAPALLTPIRGGFWGDFLAIDGIAPFILDGVNLLIAVVRDFQIQLLTLNIVSLTLNALFGLRLRASLHQPGRKLPWYRIVATLPGLVSILFDLTLVVGFAGLLLLAACVWGLLVVMIGAMLGALVFGAFLKKLLTPVFINNDIATGEPEH